MEEKNLAREKCMVLQKTAEIQPPFISLLSSDVQFRTKNVVKISFPDNLEQQSTFQIPFQQAMALKSKVLPKII